MIEKWKHQSLSASLRSMKDLLHTDLREAARDRGTRAVLFDISTSMAGEPIERLKRVALEFPLERTFVFSNLVYEVEPAQVQGLSAVGDTRLATALNYLADLGIRKVVLVTDGQPTEPETDVLAAGARFETVEAIFVGLGTPPEILERLTKGRVQAGKLDPRELPDKIRGLLEPPRRFDL